MCSIKNQMMLCLEPKMNRQFLFGTNSDIYGQDSKPCQQYMAQYCSKNWDEICENASQKREGYFPDDLNFGGINTLSRGEILIRNSAKEKYLKKMYNCSYTTKLFNPHDPNSVQIGEWVDTYGGNTCIPQYFLSDAQIKEIDVDPVMNHILQNPRIAMDILINIYNNMKKSGNLYQLRGKKLGIFYGLG